jgi:polyhydroxyalkanoate synthase
MVVLEDRQRNQMPSAVTEAVDRPPEKRRLGPRPLGVHLTAALMAWTSSLAAWPAWRSGWNVWSGTPSGPDGAQAHLAAKAAAIRKALDESAADGFETALRTEIIARQRALLSAIETYRHHPYRRSLPEAPSVWNEGTTRLLDFGAGQGSAGSGKPALLLVPSLVNRCTVLDLAPGSSLARALAEAGFRTFLVDWDRPGPLERRFDLTDYIAGRLDAALEVALDLAARPVALAGYCMGGNLALGLAVRRQRDLAGLALLATPWDFHAEDPAQAVMAARVGQIFEPVMASLGELPVDAVQSLFALLDPLLVARKFLAFGRLDPESAAAARFVALEDWLNDGIPLAAGVARECLAGWYGRNDPAKGAWHIAGRPVRPESLKLPVLAMVPSHDRIVPPDSAQALAKAIPGADILNPPLGHIGMVVSGRAPDQAWKPLMAWLESLSSAAARAAK